MPPAQRLESSYCFSAPSSLKTVLFWSFIPAVGNYGELGRTNVTASTRKAAGELVGSGQHHVCNLSAPWIHPRGVTPLDLRGLALPPRGLPKLPAFPRREHSDASDGGGFSSSH